jgi:DNA (cytosine-5)-methyltransferase 3A
MIVLSLFDGISCGQLALQRAGIKIDKYFASEIDKYTIQITQKNFPNTIQLGNIKNIKGSDLPKIDLLIGGSPCQGFSFAGKQLNFEDKRSVLFFEYVRLLKECKPKYFLLENVKMKKESQDIISNYLNIEPIEINSSLLSAQNRKRLYWTNIPNIKQPENKGILLKDFLDNSNNFEYLNEPYTLIKNPTRQKSGLIFVGYRNKRIRKNGVRPNTNHLSRVHKQPNRIYSSEGIHPALPSQETSGRFWILDNNNKVRKLTLIECERLQTVPDNYTEGISKNNRYKCLGNGWTVDVIVHIFRHII